MTVRKACDPLSNRSERRQAQPKKHKGGNGMPTAWSLAVGHPDGPCRVPIPDDYFTSNEYAGSPKRSLASKNRNCRPKTVDFSHPSRRRTATYPSAVWR